MKNSKWIWRGIIGLALLYSIGNGISRHVQMNRLAHDLRHGSPEVKLVAAKALMKRDRLYDKTQQMPKSTRIRVMNTVEQIEGAAAMRQMMLLLKDGEEDVRKRVTKSIASRGIDHLDMLVPAIKDSDENVRNGVKAALVIIGEPAIPRLQASAKETDLRGHAFEVMVSIGEPSVPAIIELLATGEQDVKMAAVDSLAKIGSMKATPALLKATGDVAAVRRVAISAICTIGDPQTTDLLIEVLGRSSDDGEVRARAARALSVIGSDRAISALTGALGDLDLKVRTSAITGLQSRRIGGRAVQPVMAAMSSGSRDVRHAGASVLEKVDAPEAAAALVTLARDSDPMIRASAARGLGVQTGSIRSDVLVSMLSDSDGSVGDAAAESLYRLGTPDRRRPADTSAVVSSLVGALTSAQGRETKFRAASVLGRIGAPAIPALKNTLASGGDAGKWAAYALGQTGDPSARPALEKFASSTDPDMASIVQRALTRL